MLRDSIYYIPELDEIIIICKLWEKIFTVVTKHELGIELALAPKVFIGYV